MRDRISRLPWYGRFLYNFGAGLFRRGVVPTDILRKLGPFSGYAIKIYTRRRLKSIPEDELVIMEQYLE